MHNLDIAICGCGPGGLAAALLLHRAGHRVSLMDQWDAPRPVGSGLMLQPTGMAVLGELGLATHMGRLGRRIDRLFGRTARSGRVVLDVHYGALRGALGGVGEDGRDGVHGVAVHRAALFAVLHGAVVAAGIAIGTGRTVAGVTDDRDGRPRLRLADGELLAPVDLVVDALGARSPLARQLHPRARRQTLPYGAIWATLPWPGSKGPFADHTLEQRYLGANVMVGVLPVGRRHEGGPEETTFFWSLKSDAYEAWRAAGLEAWKARVAAVWPQTATLLAHITSPDQLILASYGHHTLRRPFASRVAIIGDAAHATSPQLGQGANMALLDALALARGLAAAGNIPAALADYAARRRGHVRLYQAMSAAFTPFYQSDSRLLPAIRDALIAPVSRLPGVPRLLANTVAGNLGRPLARIG